jgi:hypothetical protein
MLVIGNQDRHCDNWGISTKSDYRCAPIYDNGASLGFQLTEERIKMMFKEVDMFTAFSNRSFSLIGIENRRKPKYLDLLSVIRRQYPKEITEAVDRLVNLNRDSIEKVLNRIPV